MEAIEQFLAEMDAVFWLATEKSLADKSIMEAIRHIGLHEGIVNKSFRFIVLQPKEYLKCKLPAVLNAYNPFREDDYFDQKFASTLRSIRKKVHNRDRCPNRSASTAAISGLSSTEQQTAPLSDVTNGENPTSDQRELNIVVEDPGNVVASAEPIRHPTVENVDNNEAQAPVIYNINITGSNNNIQVGSGNQMVNEADTNNQHGGH